MSRASDLIRVAELIKLAGQTAGTFSETTTNGQVSKITAISRRIEAAADELADVGREMEREASRNEDGSA